MVKYRFTNKAINDLDEIWNYTSIKWSEVQADTYYRLLVDSCRKITGKSVLYKKYPIIRDDLFGLRAGHHIIFYRRLENEDIEIVRILHEQMDLKNRIKDK